MDGEPQCPFGFEMRNRVANLEEGHGETSQQVKEMHEWMVENGLKDDVKEIKKLRQEAKEWRNTLKRLAAGAFLTAFFGGVATWILWAMGIVSG